MRSAERLPPYREQIAEATEVRLLHLGEDLRGQTGVCLFIEYPLRQQKRPELPHAALDLAHEGGMRPRVRRDLNGMGEALDLLGKQERFQLIEECYQHLCAALEREGRTPHQRTQDKMTGVRALQREGEHLQSGGAYSSDSAVEAGEASAERIVTETRHLIGREAWLCGVQQMVQGFPAKKLLILQGPIGVGKSSELTRLERLFHNSEPPRPHVIWLPLPAAEWSSSDPEAALDVLLATLFSECGLAPLPAEAPRARLIAALLTHLEQYSRPTVILLDNAECLLEEDGRLAACWEGFLMQFVRSRHQASLLLATKEWHGWPGRGTIFVAETFVPPLTQQESVRLLQRLGLQEVPIEDLETVSARVAGIPLLLEWTAKLVADPLLLDRWESLHEQESPLALSNAQEQLTYRELNRRANQLAHTLGDRGVAPETLVSLLTERGNYLLIALLAVFKAGGAYLPLDPHYPPERLRYILEHSGSHYLLAAKEFAPVLTQVLKDTAESAL